MSWSTDPDVRREQMRLDNARRRAAKRKWERENYRKPCVECGTDIDGHDRHTRCRDCHTRLVNDQHEALLCRIEAMYNAGEPLWKIAEALGRKFERTRDGALSLPELTELHRAGRIAYRYNAYERKQAA